MTALAPTAIAALCNNFLATDDFQDYCPNGLQIDGGHAIDTIVTGVTACQALIDAAIARSAQAILVHHGYFWKGESAPLVSMKGKRIRTLLQHGISLLAYHLPLDAHPVIGNNALLAQALELNISGALYPHEKRPIGNLATCPPQSPADLAKKIAQVLRRAPVHIDANYPTPCNQPITRLAICTGAAQEMIEQAAMMGAQAFISGEISERTTHQARELGVHYYACGHHASEIFGVKALGEWLVKTHGLNVHFIDIPNPV